MRLIGEWELSVILASANIQTSLLSVLIKCGL